MFPRAMGRRLADCIQKGLRKSSGTGPSFFRDPLTVLVAMVSLLLGLAIQLAWMPADYKPPPSPLHDHSLMMACGKGFHSAIAPAGSELEAFLNHDRERITPEDAVKGVTLGNPCNVQRTHRYLFCTIAAAWWLFGLSWNSICILQAIVLSITSLVLYGLFRLGMNRLLSAAGTLLFISTPLVLSFLWSERDFSKAPFILGCILVLGCLAKEGVSTRRYFVLAVLSGLVAGLGMGFRADMMLCVVPSVAVLALCPRKGTRRILLQRISAIGLMLAVWYLCASPILTVNRADESQTFHSMAATFGFNPDGYEPTIRLLPIGGDVEISASYSSLAARTAGARPVLFFFRPAAEKLARQFLLEAVRSYPADCVNRAYAAVSYILDARWFEWSLPADLSSPMKELGKAQIVLADHWQQHRLFYLLAAFVFLACYNVRTAWIALLLVLYFCGTTSLQFMVKHVFHLCFLPLWFMGFLIDQSWRSVSRGGCLVQRRWRDASFLIYAAGRVFIFFAVSAAVMLGPLHAARVWQSWTVGTLITKYANAELEPISFDVKPSSQPGCVQLCTTNWPKPDFDAMLRDFPPADRGDKSPYLRAEYLVAVCEVDDGGTRISLNYSRSDTGLGGIAVPVRVPGARQPMRAKFFAPIYELSSKPCVPTPPPDSPQSLLFTGLTLPDKDAACIKALYRVKNLKDFRLLPYLTLPDDTSCFHRYDDLPDFFKLPR